MNDLQILEDIMQKAKAQGVEADAMIVNSITESVSYRMRKLENHEKACENHMNLRVIIGKRHACISTNQLSDAQQLLDKAIIMAKAAPENPDIRLLTSDYDLQESDSSLSIFDHTHLSKEQLIDNAKNAEEAALSYDKVENSEGASSQCTDSTISLASTKGTICSYRSSCFYNSISVIAKDKDSMEQGSDYTAARNYQDLKDPSEIGEIAAERAVKKLNPKKIATCKVPVVFDTNVSGSILQGFSSAINGLNIANGGSFLKEKMGKKIFNQNVNIIDDPQLSRGLSSYPFDGEGIVGEELELVKEGVLHHWLLDGQAASKLHLSSNGRAARDKNGVIKPAHSNLYMEAGKHAPEYIISQIKRGVYITDLFSFGSNIITGDYSHGAAGFLIEDGKITDPISEFTIASNMHEMFMNMIPANDLQFDKLVNAPTIVVAQMTVAGT